MQNVIQPILGEKDGWWKMRFRIKVAGQPADIRNVACSIYLKSEKKYSDDDDLYQVSYYKDINDALASLAELMSGDYTVCLVRKNINGSLSFQTYPIGEKFTLTSRYAKIKQVYLRSGDKTTARILKKLIKID